MQLSKPIPQPKPRPRALEKADRRKALEARDKRESDKVKIRSGGGCEVVVVNGTRCHSRAAHVHHLISGIGVRGVGTSALARHKVHCCVACHTAIHAHVLLPLGGVRFQRVR